MSFREPDDFFDEIPRYTEKELTKIAHRVAQLLRRRGALERFQEKLRAYFAEREAKCREHDQWYRKRMAHFQTRVLLEPRLRDERFGPPKVGWQWEWQRLVVEGWIPAHLVEQRKRLDRRRPSSEHGKKKRQEDQERFESDLFKHLGEKVFRDPRMRDFDAGPPKSRWIWLGFNDRIWGWVPADLSRDKEPDVSPPLDDDGELSLVQKYAVLSAIHDRYSHGDVKVNPWSDVDVEVQPESATTEAGALLQAAVAFEALIHRVAKCETGVPLDAFLADVANDLESCTGPAKRRSLGGRRRGKWADLLDLYDEMKNADPHVTRQRVCDRYAQKYSRQQKPTPKNLSDALYSRKKSPNSLTDRSNSSSC